MNLLHWLTWIILDNYAVRISMACGVRSLMLGCMIYVEISFVSDPYFATKDEC